MFAINSLAHVRDVIAATDLQTITDTVQYDFLHSVFVDGAEVWIRVPLPFAPGPCVGFRDHAS